MSLPDATSKLFKSHGIAFREDVSLAKRTWWRVGGNADAVITATSSETVAAVTKICHRTRCPLFVLGNGSNLLVSDYGIRGVVLLLAGDLADVHPQAGSEGAVLVAGAGLKLTVLLARANRHNWGGLECFAGIPGTLGGAIRMNAGANLGETSDCLLDVDVVLANGETASLTQSELNMGYRTCQLPPGSVVTRARLQYSVDEAQASQTAIAHHLDYRKRTQPLHLPSCGSTFRNPQGDHAGRLIDAAGLKGFRLGDAQVSEKHANFIVNLGTATADQIRGVLEHIQRTVQERYGVELHQEVHFAGDWEHWKNQDK